MSTTPNILTIDQGNSHPHAGIFHNGKLEEVLPVELVDPDKESISVFSSVAKESQIKNLLHNPVELKSFWANGFFFDMPVHYEETLGEDRLYQAAYLYFQNQTPTLLIDAGTFITVDVVDSNGFQGGFILPGIKTLFDNYQKGQRLPHLSSDSLNLGQALPQKTNDAITQGVGLMLKESIEAIIKKEAIEKIMITGGEGFLVKKLLDENSFLSLETQFEPHLIHHSLHFLALKSLKLQ